MLLTKRLYTTGITLIAALLLSACQKETLPIADGNKTVNITLSTKVGGDGSSAASPEDAIHTLRIYAFDINYNLIGYHYEDVPNTPETYSFSMPLNLSYKEDFPTGSVTAKFYVVANEGGATINGTFPEAEINEETGLWKWVDDTKTIDPDGLSALLITDYGTKTETDIEDKGLPMSYKDDNVKITTETNQPLEFGMKRAVVKLETTFTNQGSAVTVTNIRLGNFQADKGYLFPHDGEIVPENVSYTEQTELSPNLHISQEGTGKVTYYQLPSAARNSEYTFGFSLDNGTSFGPSVLIPDNGSSIESIDRNHGLGINVTVEDDNIRFSVPEVQPWNTSTGGIITVE